MVRIRLNNDCGLSLEVLARLIHIGFNKKFITFFFTEEESIKVATNLAKFFLAHPGVDIFYAIKNEEVCGCIVLAKRVQAEERPLSILAMESGLYNKVRLGLLRLLLHHIPKKDEQYVELLVVKDGFQGEGIGRKLLKAAKQNIGMNEYVSLYVAKSNVGAHQLYLSEGFLNKGNTYSVLMELVVGFRRWVFMKWEP